MSNKKLLNARSLPGLIIAVAGVVLLLNSFDVVDLGRLSRYWPLLLIAFGAHWVIEGGGRVFGSIFVAVGVTLQLDNLDLLDVNIRQVVNFWPLLLIGFGAKILLRPKGKDNSVVGIILITIGAYFQAHNLEMIEFGIDQLWPIAVVAAGVGMLRKAMARS